MFGRKKKAVCPHYNDTIPADRVWDQTHTVSLRAVGNNDGFPLIYAVTENQISLVWRGKERYKDAVQAVIAAESHIEDSFKSILKATPERRFSFDWNKREVVDPHE